ncbi:MAG: bifunctional pyr operon transcriptional regulator/uracil phosphoribosyltransferase PyrR [Oxalobacteraceae bacterium]|jgi:pyrimidine operon attenuation protein/uracil phosphoribosyltransferase|nr:bifunctional pyr operon transcriptional regulator/uracil phosphoribosyltransferase PyrR [Oxalobacteraceae bacterium]
MNSIELHAEALYSQLENELKSALVNMPKLAIVGIYSGGAWLAERLAKALDVPAPGYMDVSFYRDDYAKRGLKEEVRPSQIPFEVEGANILLVDDVLYTGRTTRAAINTLFDYGRPSRIMLAALVDRGGRELPISADFVAKTIVLPVEQMLVLKKADDGRLSLTIDHA